MKKLFSQLHSESTTNFQKYYGRKLPLTFNPTEYGKVILSVDDLLFVKMDSRTLIVIQNLNSEVNKVQYYKHLDLVLEWVDTKVDDKSFVREIGSSKYLIEDNVVTSATTIHKRK